MNEEAACRCKRQIPVHIHFDFIGPEKMFFTRHAARAPGRALDRERLMGLMELERVAEVLRSHPQYAAPAALVDRIKSFIDQGGLRPLD